jgi:hypothetical protein
MATGADLTSIDALAEVLALLSACSRREETLEFLCSHFRDRVELPTRQVTTDGIGYRPPCGGPAEIRWHHP